MPREVPVLSAIAFAVAIGFGVIAPAVPIFARDFGVGRTAAAAVISAFAFMRFVSALSSGRLVDRFGERAVLATGLALVAVTTGLAGLANSYFMLLALRALGGIGSAMFTVAAVSLLLRVVDAEYRGRANGWFQAGFLAGGLAGPVFGGLLTEVSVRLPFFVYAVSVSIAGVIAMAFLAKANLQHKEKADQAAETERTTLRQALGFKAFRAALASNLGAGWSLWGVRTSLIPLFVIEAMRVGPIWTGIGFLVSSVFQAILLMPAGRFVDTIGRKPAIIGGGLVAAAAMGTIALFDNLPAYLVAMALFGIAGAYLGVAPSAVVGDVVRGRGGQVVAAYQMAGDLGAVVGPLAAGALADEVSFGAAFGMTAGVVLIGPLLALRMPETRYSRADEVMPTREGGTP
ncbi:MFS transporter [Tenggerimyces flavus]|uniref:MFS transporter n=1 Tax=Tenggerimyces flavus TaxID=1708749 RepID=A0ABV7Y8Y9_9ACTN|nr:MFS transporter [Tenggerimyces flavus]MBM7783557.1 MFS family permease [Tenggerimyces flavus]